jgi:outer membrane protein assembly factor BamB
MQSRRVLTSVLLIAALSLGGVLAADQTPKRLWPSWRGPDGTGSAVSGTYATKWSGTENLEWKTELPGKGCSTPAVWHDRILVTAPADGQDALLAYGWNGKLLWTTKVGKARQGKHRNGSSSNPSPVTDGKYIAAYFRSGNLAGLTIDGKLLWSTNLQERFGRDTLYWDIGTSPVFTEKHAVIAVMHKGESFVAAFDKKSGDIAWKVARNYKCPVEGDHSYATPIVVERDGKQVIVVWGAERLTAYDAEKGKLLWSCAGFNPEEKRNWVAVASPVITGGIAVVPYGRGSRLAGIQLGGEGDVTKTHRVWTRKGTGSFVPTPAAFGDKTYILRDGGEVECIDVKTGKTEWKNRLPKHRAKYYASPVVADGKLYATREDGVIIVAKLSESLEVLSQNDMGERMIASPVPVDGKLLLRGVRHLFCVGSP